MQFVLTSRLTKFEHLISRTIIKDLHFVYEWFAHASDMKYRSTRHKGFFFCIAQILSLFLYSGMALHAYLENNKDLAGQLVFIASFQLSVLALYMVFGKRQLMAIAWYAIILIYFLGIRTSYHDTLVNFSLVWVVLATAILPMLINVYIGFFFAVMIFIALPEIPQLPIFASLDRTLDYQLVNYSFFGCIVVILVVVSEMTRYNVLLVAKMSRANEQKTYETLLDGIRYATGLREQLLHSPISDQITEECVRYYDKPFNVLSGDFFYARLIGHRLFLFLADCTGHGVPATFISAIGITYIEEAIYHHRITHTNKILDFMRARFIKAQNKNMNLLDSNFFNDSLVCSIICIDFNEQTLNFCSSYQKGYFIMGDSLRLVNGLRYPLSSHPSNASPFVETTFPLESIDKVILGTDGFYDQHNKLGKKLGYKSILSLLKEDLTETAESTYKRLVDKWEDWKGNEIQVDDVSLLVVDVVRIHEMFSSHIATPTLDNH